MPEKARNTANSLTEPDNRYLWSFLVGAKGFPNNDVAEAMDAGTMDHAGT